MSGECRLVELFSCGYPTTKFINPRVTDFSRDAQRKEGYVVETALLYLLLLSKLPEFLLVLNKLTQANR
jgi:hypothetical protein